MQAEVRLREERRGIAVEEWNRCEQCRLAVRCHRCGHTSRQFPRNARIRHVHSSMFVAYSFVILQQFGLKHRWDFPIAHVCYQMDACVSSDA